MVVKKRSLADRSFFLVNSLVGSLFFIIAFYPLYFVLIASFSNPVSVVLGEVWWRPIGVNLSGYKAVFEDNRVILGYANSLFIMVAGTMVNVVFTVLAAYPLSRKDFRYRNIIMGLYVFTMLFSGGLIPTYLVVKNLGMIDTRAALIIPNALLVWNMIITRTFFIHSIPDSLLEAAQLDGCSDIYFLWKVVLPLSGPILAVITLYYAVGHWNSFFSAMIYLKTASKYPLQMILRDILIQNQVMANQATMQGAVDAESMVLRQEIAQLLKYSLIIVASAPLLIIYPFVQKYFVKGVLIGSIKG
jgi:multiple sugar transport system permease protein/putative aldouronate transport system permease protein